MLPKLKGRMYCPTVRSVPLYGCDTPSLCIKDVRVLADFDHWFLLSVARIELSDRVSNAEVRYLVLGTGTGTRTSLIGPRLVYTEYLSTTSCSVLRYSHRMQGSLWRLKYEMAAWNEKMYSELKQCELPKRSLNQLDGDAEGYGGKRLRSCCRELLAVSSVLNLSKSVKPKFCSIRIT